MSKELEMNSSDQVYIAWKVKKTSDQCILSSWVAAVVASLHASKESIYIATKESICIGNVFKGDKNEWYSQIFAYISEKEMFCLERMMY